MDEYVATYVNLLEVTSVREDIASGTLNTWNQLSAGLWHLAAW